MSSSNPEEPLDKLSIENDSLDNISLEGLAWKSCFDQQVEPDEESLIKARVASHQGSQIVVLTTSGEAAIPIQLTESGGDLGVGDWILLDPQSHRVSRRLERESLITRKGAGQNVREQIICANVDTIFIVSSCNQDFNPSRLERYLAVALEAKVTPIILLTKSDLCDDPASYQQLAQKIHNGIIVETLDARSSEQIEVLRYWCRPGQTISLVGSSGVGKSTLANSLGANDIKTAGIREDDAKGRHTTTARMMHQIKFGGWLIDNPGMREMQLPACEQGIDELFVDVQEFADQCKFRDCRHEGDAGCAILPAIESGDLDERRFKSFMKLRSEQERNSRTLAQTREQNRRLGKYYKKVMEDKKKMKDGS